MHLKNKFKQHFYVSFFILASLLIFPGCNDKEYDEEAPQSSNIKHVMEDPNYRPGEDVPNPTLAAGQILNIRLVYGINEKDENNTEWYKVELRREDGRWYDYVKIEGLIRSGTRHWDDYIFNSQNFNYQIENKTYGIDTLDGIYKLIITGSNGHESEYRLNWKDGRWTNMSSARTFYVP
ncbi:MAG: hypothetical protein ACOYUZ_06625 [Patescibacteria group bacterium]